MKELPSWLLPLWDNLVSRRERMPHALLFTGPQGSGKRQFSEAFAASLLCRNTDKRGAPCGVCEDCRWLASGNHPDILRVLPASEQEEDEGESSEASGKKEKSKSSQILIDQIRDLQAAVEVGSGGHSGGFRVVILEPAEAMNMAAANALLKLLEEPGSRLIFLMSCHEPRRLLPTIRSRCQVLPFPRPATAEAAAWIEKQGISDAEALLGFCSGLPLQVERMHSKGLVELRKTLANELSRLPEAEPLKLAAQWETRLKAKDAAEKGLDMSLLVSWLLRWLSDGIRASQGLPPRFYADFGPALSRLSEGSTQAWQACLREFFAYRRNAQHPLNPRLFLEEMFLVLHRRTALLRGTR